MNGWPRIRRLLPSAAGWELLIYASLQIGAFAILVAILPKEAPSQRRWPLPILMLFVTLLSSCSIPIMRALFGLRISRRRTLRLVATTLALLVTEMAGLVLSLGYSLSPTLCLNLLVGSTLGIFLISQFALFSAWKVNEPGDAEWIAGLSGATKELLCVLGILVLNLCLFQVALPVAAWHDSPIPLGSFAFMSLFAAPNYLGMTCGRPSRQLGLEQSVPRAIRVGLLVAGWLFVTNLAVIFFAAAPVGNWGWWDYLSISAILLFGPVATGLVAMGQSCQPPLALDEITLDRPPPPLGRLFGPLFPKHYVPQNSADESRQA